MPANALVQTRIDPAIRDRAAAVRILLTRTANEGALPFDVSDNASHDAWFRAMVQEAMDDPRPVVPQGDVEAEFDAMHSEALARARA
jgi:DNA-damage-inducible protein J